MTQQRDVISDLVAEGDELDRVIAGLDGSQWALPTPAVGWTIKHQVAHLAATFRVAGLAAADPEGFKALASRLSDDFNANVDAAMAPYMSLPPDALFERWQTDRGTAEKALGALPPMQLVPWLVRPLPAVILACAGMMELFGHGQDIADAVGVYPERTDRIGNLVGFAVRTWDFGYLARDLPTPDVEFRFELTAPSGAVWEFGPDDADQRITGDALDFCLLVTRRRHRDDLDLTATGEIADHWLSIAQAYRGPAGPGRSPGQFAPTKAA